MFDADHEIRISLKHLDHGPAQGRLVLQIDENGKGIPMDKVASLLDLGHDQRADAAASNEALYGHFGHGLNQSLTYLAHTAIILGNSMQEVDVSGEGGRKLARQQFAAMFGQRVKKENNINKLIAEIPQSPRE